MTDHKGIPQAFGVSLIVRPAEAMNAKAYFRIKFMTLAMAPLLSVISFKEMGT